MKKTLISIAVFAASGTSFAQVTITGNLAMGYRSTTTGASAGNTVPESTTAGFGVDTSEIDFAATEDLGGGMKITAKLALAGADRSGESNTTTAGGVTGRDASLTLQTKAGLFSLASAQAADYLSSIAGVGAYYQGFDGKIFGARVNRDTATYLLPLGTFTLGVSYQEAANNLGLGGGTAGAVAGQQQPLTGYLVNYAQGSLVVNAQYIAYNSRIEGADSGVGGGVKDAYRLSGAYDFGAAKLGLGAQVASRMNGAKQTDTLIGLSVPVGALTIGAQWASHNATDFVTTNAAGDTNGQKTGSEFQLRYALSKRTAIVGGYAQWTQTVGNSASSAYNMLLSHSF